MQLHLLLLQWQKELQEPCGAFPSRLISTRELSQKEVLTCVSQGGFTLHCVRQ